MSSKLIVVLGATGNQGGSVVSTFLSEPGWRVRGISRNPSSAASQKLKERGVDVVAGNLDNPASLVAAFKGAAAVFSASDFWALYADPELQKTAKPGQSQNHRTYENELQQGKNIFDAASQTEGLERLIFSGLSDVVKWSKGKYKQVYHFDSKAHAIEYGKATYPDLWKKTSILQLGFFLLNFLNSPFLIPRKVSIFLPPLT
jgi:nucleoside-diphosphate-sugar epimerase